METPVISDALIRWLDEVFPEEIPRIPGGLLPSAGPEGGYQPPPHREPQTIQIREDPRVYPRDYGRFDPRARIGR
jgi:hypothetical protein